jgi:hypothetical protein
MTFERLSARRLRRIDPRVVHERVERLQSARMTCQKRDRKRSTERVDIGRDPDPLRDLADGFPNDLA